MRFSKALRVLSLVGCAVMSSQLAVAADKGWYAGVSAGRSKAKIDNGKINKVLRSAGFATATTTARDERDTGYKLYGGYQINKNFALEGGYFDLGRFGFTSTTTGPGGTLSGHIKIKGVNLDAVGTLPITGKFSALGRLGVQYAETKDSISGTGGVLVLKPDPSKRETNYKLGWGVQYDLTQSIGLRGEMERYRINDAVSNRENLDFYSAGMVVKW